MQLHKAVRHLVLTQASRAARALRARGHADLATEIDRTADLLVFAPIDQSNTNADDGGDERVSGRSVLVRVMTDAGIAFQRTIAAGGFELYARDAQSLTATGDDARAEANAERASAIFAEFHAARRRQPLSADELAALRRQLPMSSIVGRRLPVVVWCCVIAACLAAAVLSSGAARALAPLTIAALAATVALMTTGASSRAAVIAAVVVPLAWMGQSVPDAAVSCAIAVAVAAWCQSEHEPLLSRALLLAVVGGLFGGVLITLSPVVGSGLVAGIAASWVAGWLLFVTFRPTLAVASIVGIALGAMIADRLGLVAELSATDVANSGGGLMARLPFMPVVVAVVVLLVILSAGGWFAGTHRYPLSMLLPVTLLVLILVAWRGGYAARALPVVASLAAGFGLRALEYFRYHRPVAGRAA